MDNRSRVLVNFVYLPLALCLLALVLYYPALPKAIPSQDHPVLLFNPDVSAATGLTDLWVHNEWGDPSQGPCQYRPIPVITYHLNVAVSGFDPFAFRLVNLLLLAALGTVAALWIRTFTGSFPAWLMAAVLVAHPLPSETINLITGRALLLALLGVTLFGWLHRRALLSGQGSVVSAGAALFAVVLALGSDSTGFLVIPVAILQAFLGPHPDQLDRPWLRHTAAPASPQPARLRPMHVGTAGLLLIPVTLYAIGRTLAIGWDFHHHSSVNDLTSNPLIGLTWWERWPASFALAGYYLGQLFLPQPDLEVFPFLLPDWYSPSTWLGLALVVILLAGLLVTLRRRHWTCIPLALALGQYLLTTHMFVARPLYAAPRLALPMLLALVMVVAHFIHRITLANNRRHAALVALLAVFTLLSAIAAWERNLDGTHRLLLCEKLVNKYPQQPIAMFLYGMALNEAGYSTRALPWLQNTVEARPDSVQARRSLAELLLALGRPGDAEEQFLRIVELAPANVPARRQLARFAIERGDSAQAKAHLDALQPEHSSPRR